MREHGDPRRKSNHSTCFWYILYLIIWGCLLAFLWRNDSKNTSKNQIKKTTAKSLKSCSRTIEPWNAWVYLDSRQCKISTFQVSRNNKLVIDCMFKNALNDHTKCLAKNNYISSYHHIICTLSGLSLHYVYCMTFHSANQFEPSWQETHGWPNRILPLIPSPFGQTMACCWIIMPKTASQLFTFWKYSSRRTELYETSRECAASITFQTMIRYDKHI